MKAAPPIWCADHFQEEVLLVFSEIEAYSLNSPSLRPTPARKYKNGVLLVGQSWAKTSVGVLPHFFLQNRRWGSTKRNKRRHARVCIAAEDGNARRDGE